MEVRDLSELSLEGRGDELMLMIYDLTMMLDERTPMFPQCPKQIIKQVATIADKGWNETQITCSSHFGTHMDAPFHMLEEGKKLTDFPVDKFFGSAVVIDVRGKQEIDADLGLVQKDDIVFFCTGHAANAYRTTYYESNPVLAPALAERLVEKRVKMVGLDSWTPDNAPFTLHKLFFRHDIVIAENLVNLEPLIGKRFQCFVLPMKIKDADGAPCRVVAIL